MSAEQFTYLSNKNYHERDSHIVFDEPNHIYSVNGDPNYVSVTTFVKSHFSSFDANSVIKNIMSSKKWKCSHKYWGKTPEEIKQLWENNANDASKAGTAMHLDIERFYNNIEVNNNSEEFSYFLNFNERFKNKLKPWRTEMMVWDEEYKLAGSIDMIFENEDNNLEIYDWKRTKEIVKTSNFDKWANKECIEHLPDTNYWQYSLQLNVYKHLIEKNYGRKVSNMYLLCLHPNNKNKNFIREKVFDLSQEVTDLIKLHLDSISSNYSSSSSDEEMSQE